MNPRLDNPLTGADPLLRGVVITSVVGLGSAAGKALTTFQEIPDIGPRWTFVAAYGAARCIGWP